jgi:arylsulfatase
MWQKWLLSFTNASSEKKAAIAKELPGKDFSSNLAEPEKAGPYAVRDEPLFCFNTFATLDGEVLEKARDLLKPGYAANIKESGLPSDMMRRGAIRGVFDGLHQFTRYFSPKQHNRPVTEKRGSIYLPDNKSVPFFL